ncbi:hypothetical protein BJ875DRAFT_375751 [Amylocarpus encephaloides]|uniref:Chitin-binding type-4 domain-containing protein n=1 Tax=Amylocarpus encephaloides TaxID=45428 RepID=A0A9P7YJJ8_9HELO|nr:hypothetical protein BJ875DRAFT_375751 [Amylocarpus encephaloides]
MLFTQSQLLVLGLSALSNAHMIMNTPVPFGKSSLSNSPLEADGSDFPCKQRTGVYEAEGASNSMALGSTQPLKFTGGATHGGGSCQISITYDKQPTKNSVWKVIHSIVGGCPVQGVAGNVGDSATSPSPTEYTFPVPDSLPAGDAVLAWTWFNKVGNREMYMNCAPVTLGGSKKRDLEYLESRNVTQLMERDTAAYDALPNMFVANIESGSGCTTGDKTSGGGNLVFPNPGDSVTTMGSDALLQPTGCDAGAGASPAKPTSAAGGGDAPKTSAAAGGAPSNAPTLPGGVFATIATSQAAGPSQTAAPSAPASSAPSPTAAPASPASSAPPPAASGSTGSGSAQSGACTTEGGWNCVGGSSFQQCASGQWSAVQQMAAGTSCTPGESSSLNMAAIGSRVKRAIRFSPGHARRNMAGSA